MPKDDRVYVGHMLDIARKAVTLLGAKSRVEFDQDEALLLGLTHLIQTLGEAARKVTPEYQSAHPEIPWKKIIGMRNKVVHDYLDVDPDIVWHVVKEELNPLLDKLEGK